MHRDRMRRTLTASALFVLCACAGGGRALPPPAPPAPTPGSSTASVSIALLIPKAGQGRLRVPHYVSSQTQSAAFSVNGGPALVANLAAGAPGCTTVSGGLQCAVTVSAPVGNDAFALALYAQPDAQGPVLSRGTTTASIAMGTANTVRLTLSGVVSSIVVALADNAPAQGTAEQIAVTVSARDAAGATIVGDPYDNPITLTDSDTTGAATLSKTTLASPNDAVGVTLAFTGAAIGTVTIGARANGVAAANVTSASFTPSTVQAAGFNDWPTYGYDNKRDGYNPNSSAITPASIGALHLAWQTLGYDNSYTSQTQPILATNVGGHAGMLFAGGAAGTFAAFDALTGAEVWSTNLGQLQYACDSGLSDVVGVEATGVYDPATHTVYAAQNGNASPNGPTDNRIVQLDAATGARIASISVSPSVLPGEVNGARAGLALYGNRVYAGTSSPCDHTPWRGRVAAVHADLSGSPLVFYTDYTGYVDDGQFSGGGVWGWGGVAIDDAGTVYAGVGNTDNGAQQAPFVQTSDETAGLGDHLIAMTPDLGVLLAANSPGYTFGGSSGDLDFAGTPVLFRPVGCTDTLVAAQGKAGELIVYDAQTIANGPIARIRLAPSTDQAGSIGNPAYSPATGLLYAGVVSSSGGSLFPPGIVAVHPSGCNGATTFTRLWNTAFGPDSYANPDGILPRSAPIATAGNTLFVGTPCSPDGSGGCRATIGANGGALWALDARTGALLGGGKPILHTPDHIRMAPVIDGKWVFVIDDNADLYGLTIDSNVKAVAERHRTLGHRKVWSKMHRRT